MEVMRVKMTKNDKKYSVRDVERDKASEICEKHGFKLSSETGNGERKEDHLKSLYFFIPSFESHLNNKGFSSLYIRYVIADDEIFYEAYFNELQWDKFDEASSVLKKVEDVIKEFRAFLNKG